MHILKTEEGLSSYLKPIRCTLNLRKIIDEHRVCGVVKIQIGITDDSEIVYCVNEPLINELESDNTIRDSVLRFIDALFSENIDPDSLTNKEVISKITQEYNINSEIILRNFTKIIYFIRKILSGYGKLYPLTRDKYVEEIVVNRPNSHIMVFYWPKNLGWIRTNIFLNAVELDNIVIRLSRLAGRELSIAHPYVEAPLPDGNRIAATFSSEVSRFGSSLVIRRHREEPLTPVDIVKMGMMSSLYIAYLWLLIRYHGSIIIAGPTASGKTTLLQALLLLIPPYERVITIEDTPELNLSHHDNWDSLVTRDIHITDRDEEIDMLALTKFALRRRPDFFVIGEVRGEEARVLVHAAASGHGALTTLHADSAYSVIQRLKASPIKIGESFLQLIWSIIVLRRLKIPGKGEVRRVVEIHEVIPHNNRIVLKKIASLDIGEDRLLPEDPEELFNNSYRLKTLINYFLKDKNTLINELLSMKSFIDQCDNCNFNQFIKNIKKYYMKEKLSHIY
ncbi:type II/IV secretion system ATPase subunit [Pyrofollis japonicus]|nr:type II/IV secretion system ATPase subunit [Pyrofollis japonicus]